MGEIVRVVISRKREPETKSSNYIKWGLIDRRTVLIVRTKEVTPFLYDEILIISLKGNLQRDITSYILIIILYYNISYLIFLQ